MENKTKNIDTKTDSLLNIDEIVSKYQKEQNIKTSDFENDDVIFKFKAETTTFNNDNKNNVLQNKNNILDDIINIDKQLNSLNNKLNSTTKHEQKTKKNNDILPDLKLNDKVQPKDENIDLVSNFSKIQPDDDNEQTKKQNIEDKIIFNTDSIKNNNSSDKKKKFSFFRKEKQVSLKDYNPNEVVDKIEKNNDLLDQNQSTSNNKKITKKEIKQLKRNIPKFYKFEISVTIFWLALNLIFFCGSIITLGFTLNSILNEGYSYWLLLPQCIFNFITLAFLILNINNLRTVYKELKINNYSINRELPSAFIKKKYKSIVTFNIYLNWYSFAVYLLWSCAILLTFIVTYFVNLTTYKFSEFGNLIVGGNNTPLILVIVFGSLIGITFIIQMISLIFNKKRQSEIDIYYQKEIISDEMVLKYKKVANKKGIIMFFVLTFILTFTILITWLVLRRKAKKMAKNL